MHHFTRWFESWNPQLLRELKGRFKIHNLVITVLISGLVQLVTLGLFLGQLPGTVQPEDIYIRTFPSFSYNYTYDPVSDINPDAEGYWIISNVYPSSLPDASLLRGVDVSAFTDRPKTGDMILKVDGQVPTSDYSMMERLLAGGTTSGGGMLSAEPLPPVTLEIQRSGQDGTQNIVLPRVRVPERYNSYCLMNQSYVPMGGPSYCALVPGTMTYDVDWNSWGTNLFMAIAWEIILTLEGIGVFLIVSNLEQEERRGTLNFIRLSPQSSIQVLTGKLVGVPSLLYIGVALALPMHMAIAHVAGISLSFVASGYILVIMHTVFLYGVAILLTLITPGLGGFQPWLFSGLALFPHTLFISLAWSSNAFVWAAWSLLFYPDWFLLVLHTARLGYTSLSTSAIAVMVQTGVIAALINFSICLYWTWQGIQRRYHSSSATVLSKRQSYLLTATWGLMLMGITGWMNFVYSQSYSFRFEHYSLLVLHLGLFLLLIPAISPHRQAVCDWARYRHLQPDKAKRRLLYDLVWGEKSPAILAVAINGAIAFAFQMVWFAIWSPSFLWNGFWIAVSCWVWMIIYATVIQMGLLLKTPRRGLISTIVFGAMFLSQGLVLLILEQNPMQHPGLWLLIFPWATPGGSPLSTVAMTILLQWTGLAIANLQLNRSIRKMGRSASHALLNTAPPPSLLGT
jgi:hypothetical protein